MEREKGEVWIFAEQEDGVLNDVALELLGKGRELADTLGVPLAAVLLGSGVEGLAAKLFEHGADKVRLVDDPALKNYQNRSYREVMIELIEEVKPQICVYGATSLGRDLAPSIASALRCGLTADCTELGIGSYTDPVTKEEFANLLLQCRPAFGGNIIATIVNPRNWPQMATVREGVMKLPDATPGKTGELVRHEAKCLATLELPVEVLEVVRAAKSVNLKGARIIVAGGAGVGSAENFKLLHELADVLGGTVGGTRAAVDLGFCEHERQIGQTGVTVRPALYIACGISGAIQHLAGMQESQKIIAVNTDKEAPIFSVAHYGIVGDLNDVLPKMIKAIKAKAAV